MTITTKPKVAFWIVAVIAIIWNIMGVMAYLGQAYMTDEAKELLPEVEREMYENVPSWATAAFAFAVFGGLLGSLALLLKTKIANLLFTISLLGIIVQMIYNFFIINSLDIYGHEVMLMPIMIIAIGIFLFMYAKKTTTYGWLK